MRVVTEESEDARHEPDGRSMSVCLPIDEAVYTRPDLRGRFLLTQTNLVSPPPQVIPERFRNPFIRQGSGRFPGDSARWQEGNASM